MKILYAYSNCSNDKYKELFANVSVMILQQAQKYHSLLIDGLAKNSVEVTCISGLPVNRELSSKLYISGSKETINHVHYIYFSTINLGIIRRLQLVLKSFFHVLFCSANSAAICDVLNISVAIGVLAAAKLKRLTVIGIVTDVPGHLAQNTPHSMIEKINKFILNKFSGYIFLTEAMNSVVNTKHKPYIVLEGHVDHQMRQVENLLENKQKTKILMYAGSLKKIYGIERLTKAFLATSVSDWELQIYGDGDFKDELLLICNKYSNIQYCGVRLNHEIVDAEIRASLLVNPRPTDADYTKYSFPSKNMEYMASGTPVLTTDLPGMPPEYYDYVYLFQDETEEGMTATLNEIFRLSPANLHDMGTCAKQFVMTQKNNIVQAKKIVHFLETLDCR